MYTSPNGEIKVDVFFHNENIWLTQKKMAELFDVEIPTINEHLKNIFSSGELGENSAIRKFLTTANDGKNEISLAYFLSNWVNMQLVPFWNILPISLMRLQSVQKLHILLMKGTILLFIEQAINPPAQTLIILPKTGRALGEIIVLSFFYASSVCFTLKQPILFNNLFLLAIDNEL